MEDAEQEGSGEAESSLLPSRCIEHIAHALMRNGMEESQAIATAINAVKRWAQGNLDWGHGKVTAEVRAASQRALAQWEELRQSHDG